MANFSNLCIEVYTCSISLNTKYVYNTPIKNDLLYYIRSIYMQKRKRRKWVNFYQYDISNNRFLFGKLTCTQHLFMHGLLNINMSIVFFLTCAQTDAIQLKNMLYKYLMKTLVFFLSPFFFFYLSSFDDKLKTKNYEKRKEKKVCDTCSFNQIVTKYLSSLVSFICLSVHSDRFNR